MPKRWVTADTHFFHENIIRYCNRPFADVEEMNAIMVANWNNTVAPDDEVYHLGDFALVSKTWLAYDLERLFERLRGKKYLVRGNHDSAMVLRLPWEGIADQMLVGDMDHNNQVALVHNGQAWQKQPNLLGDNVPVFCANVHEIWKMKGNLLNVGVDVWHFYPVEWDKAKEYWQYRYDYYRRYGRDA